MVSQRSSSEVEAKAASGPVRKIWIDLDNSPHVPFFAPIIAELRERGHEVLVTARDCFQVCELAALLNVPNKVIGRHYGRHAVLKVAGLCLRAAQLTPTVLAAKPDVALSHGSRAQIIVSTVLRVPSILIFDYEFAKGLKFLHPDWLMVPELVQHSVVSAKSKVMHYPGIKEDVYVPRFVPDPSILTGLGLSQDNIVLTIRPPATEAHYHNPQSEVLLDAVFGLLQETPNAKAILLPRNRTQELEIRKSWSGLFESGKIIVPARALDGLNLMWYSDVVISGGGTMNREAAALGVPVYSIFRGRIGAVDQYLSDMGRLVLLESAEDVRTKLSFQRRSKGVRRSCGNRHTLDAIVANVISVVESKR